jgi:hypothetical protein
MDDSTSRFAPAPWSYAVKSATFMFCAVIVAASLAVIGLGVWFLKAGQPRTAYLNFATGAVFGLLLLLAASFTPVEYTVDPKGVTVRQRGMLKRKIFRISLDNIAEIGPADDAELFHGARLLNSAVGIFGIVGVYVGHDLNFGCYCTRKTGLVLLRFKRPRGIVKGIVISPADREGFISAVQQMMN